MSNTNKQHTAGQNANDNSPISEQNDDYWLSVARDAHTQAVSYFDANIRSNVEKNYSHFAGRHAPGSKYYKAAYRHRAKSFRPKTRSMVRKNEAALAKALFSTADAVHVSAERSTVMEHRVSAEINQELLQYRLKNTIPWFVTAMAAFQECLVPGIVISHQYWNYEEIEHQFPMYDESGQTILDESGEQSIGTDRVITSDTPAIELRPIENVLFSVAADWTDPLNTSPYLIDMISMSIGDVKAMTKQTHKTQIPWHMPSDAHLRQARNDNYDPIRSQREGKRQDAKDDNYVHQDFNTVWVHRNIIREEGRDWIFYTLGTLFRLSDPIPLEMEYPHLRPNERPYVMGLANIEAHKNYVDSITGMTAGIQQDANEINNQRRDNVSLVLNRRYFAKRGAKIDKQSLMRNVPGGVTEMNDPNNDIKVEAPPDVTKSSYEEQDRINMDFDELAGAFNSSSVQANRKLNETVGGMELLNEDSDEITEYQLRIFVETWVEPVLKQVIRLEQRHETDEALLTLMGEKVGMWDRFGINRLTDAYIQGNMNCEVNVGFGATNPTQRINKLTTGLNTIIGFAPDMAARLDKEELAAEVFGALGYKEIDRFFPKEQQQEGQQQGDPMADVEMAKIELEREKLENDRFEAEEERKLKVHLAEVERQKQIMMLAADENRTVLEIERDLQKIATDRQNFVDEILWKAKSGKPGI